MNELSPRVSKFSSVMPLPLSVTVMYSSPLCLNLTTIAFNNYYGQVSGQNMGEFLVRFRRFTNRYQLMLILHPDCSPIIP